MLIDVKLFKRQMRFHRVFTSFAYRKNTWKTAGFEQPLNRVVPASPTRLHRTGAI